MAKKEIIGKVKIYLQGGNATPAPPVGTALGVYGINLPQFCAKFNEKTKGKEDYIIPVIITIYKDRSFEFILKTPPASMLLKKACGIAKASGEPNTQKVGKVTRKQVREIAEMKMEDLNAYTIEEAMKIIEGTAKSMGIEVVEE
jgi:large subunit ribosomal protein L11